jgi:hypothetical protein
MKTNDLRHSFTLIRGNEKTVIRIRLNDECKNGHEDFAITADVYERGALGSWRDSGGGCCHDHILALKPELAPFVALHLSTWEGIPIHSVANAFYWFAGIFPDGLGQQYHGASGSSGKSPAECRTLFISHSRVTPAECEALEKEGIHTQEELQAALEDLNLPARWKVEAQAAIQQLEKWTGNEFESKATRGFWEPLPEAKRVEIQARKLSGYYLPENVAARAAAAKEAKKQKVISDLRADLAKSVEKLQTECNGEIWLAERNLPLENWIYYSHTQTFTLGWRQPAKPAEVSAALDVLSEFPYKYEIKTADGRKLSN